MSNVAKCQHVAIFFVFKRDILIRNLDLRCLLKFGSYLSCKYNNISDADYLHYYIIQSKRLIGLIIS